MKKVLTLSTLALLIASAASAQDLIITRNADEIEAKVLEVGTDVVKYKKHSNPDGPTYSIAESDVFMIKYENGDKDVFKDKEPEAAEVAASGSTTVTVVLDRRGRPVVELPPMPDNINPWGGKFKFGIRADVGWDATYLFGNEESDSAVGYHFGGTVYGEFNLPSRKGTLLGLAVGYRHTMLYTGEDLETKFSLGTVNLDIYAGGASNIRYNRFENTYEARRTISVGRYGVRLKMPVTSKYMDLDRLHLFNPVQAGIFYNVVWHFGGFGVGIDMDVMFTNLFKKEYFMDMSSFSYSMGLLFEYSF